MLSQHSAFLYLRSCLLPQGLQNGSIDAAYLRYIALQILYKIILRAIRIEIITV